MHVLPPALAPLAAYKQFVLCKFVPSRTRPGKTDKFPVNIYTGEVANAHDPAIWLDASTALVMAAAWGSAPGAASTNYGVGFVFTAADPFWFLDIDSCVEGGQWSGVALQLMAAFPGAAVEVSHSNKGLHIIGSGAAPDHRCKNIPLGLEFYTEGRFVALTGTGAQGSAASDHTPMLAALVDTYFKPDPNLQSLDWSEGPSADWRGPTDDADLLRRALGSHSAASVFGSRASFADLWNCNVEVLAKCYPDPQRSFDASSADAALAQHLAFWTGRDCTRIQNLMDQSALRRDKWDARADYLERTILNAVCRQREVLQDKPPQALNLPGNVQPSPVAAVAVAGPVVGAADLPVDAPLAEGSPTCQAIAGATFLNPEAQMELFKGCVYVADSHRVLVPGGYVYKPEQFKVLYGGYTFAMDHANERTSRDAWEAFTQSQAYKCPRADGACFKPNLPPASLVHEAGRVLVNTWWPVTVPRALGDITPFLEHMAKILPQERDRHILLCYMAACVQHKGIKFQWAPVVQGTEGNGKTLLTRCVAEAVGRRYVHWPKANKLSEKFNAWMVGKVFYAVEDIYTTAHRAEILEDLKPMITGGDGYEIEGKGVDQVSADVCGNFMFNCNPKDGLRKTRNDRRYAIFFTAQQCAADLKRDGMHGDYFPKLYNWLNNGGYAIVSEFLHTFPIPDELNPATQCQRAPLTSSTEEAIVAGQGGIEQEILEAIDQGLPGFCGGWISSMQLDHLLSRLGRGAVLPPNKRREILVALGYDWHPNLPGGRVHNMVLPDGGKPRLFLKTDSPLRNLSAAEAARAYTAAQQLGGVTANKG